MEKMKWIDSSLIGCTVLFFKVCGAFSINIFTLTGMCGERSAKKNDDRERKRDDEGVERGEKR